MTITLKPAHFAGSFVCSPSYVSNGHWAVKRSAVKDGAGLTVESAPLLFGRGINKLARPARELKDEDISRCARPTGETEWRVTSFQHVSPRMTTILLVNKAGGSTALDAKYAAIFGLSAGSTLYGHEGGLSALCDDKDDPTYCIMPVRMPGDDGAIAAMAQVLGKAIKD